MRSDESLQERYNKLSILYEVSNHINSTHDAKEVLSRVLSAAVRIMKANSGSLMLINPHSQLLDIEVAIGLSPLAAETKLKVGEGITGWVAEKGVPLLVADVYQDPRYVRLNPDVKSELAVPLIIGEKPTGVLNVDSVQVNAFNQTDLELLQALANHASQVLRNVWLLNQVQSKASHLESLFKVGQTIISSLNLDEVLNLITRETCRMMNTKLCSLMLLTPDKEELSLKACAGAGDDYSRRPNLKVNESLVGVVVRRKKPLVITDVLDSDRYRHIELARKEGLRSMLSVPLMFGEEVTGVLTVYTSRIYRFSNDEIRTLEALAGLSAVAIEKARLHGKVVDVEEQLRQNEKLSALGLLAAEVAHEIRNPLAVIKMLFHSLELNYPTSDPRHKDVEIIKQKMDQLNRIVEQVLGFARTSEPELKPVEINDLVEDIILLVRHKLKQANVELVKELASDIPPIPLDRGQLEQACLNLILNAVQAMPDGGSLTIATGLQPSQKVPGTCLVALSFSDTGMGMTAEQKKNLFTNFLTTKNTGTGLGLPIVKKIVENHSGQIEVQSAPGKGTKFTVLLPMSALAE